MSEQAIFRVTNHHADACGAPPAIDDSEPNHYLGYFENEHGEQAIFVYDRTRQAGTLSLGMPSWRERFPASSSEPPSGPGWPRAGRRQRVLDTVRARPEKAARLGDLEREHRHVCGDEAADDPWVSSCRPAADDQDPVATPAAAAARLSRPCPSR